MNVFIANISGDQALLNEEESWHCCKVLRKQVGDSIRIIDGQGKAFMAKLTRVHEKACLAELIGLPEIQHTRNYFLHIAIAPTKQIDRMEWMLEKMVEIGIDEISFLQCKNSERVNLKLDRMLRIAESAVKQSMQSRIPKINELVRFNRILESEADVRCIAHCNEAEKRTLKQLDLKQKRVLFLIGPEGDFSPEEVDLALSKGFFAVSLGENRLRTETAGLYVCQAVSILNQ